MIVSSQITQNNLQVDLRRTVNELHIDDKGNSYVINYMADKGADINLNLSQHANDLNAQLQSAITNAIPNAQAFVAEAQMQIVNDQQILAIAQATLASAQAASSQQTLVT